MKALNQLLNKIHNSWSKKKIPFLDRNRVNSDTCLIKKLATSYLIFDFIET